MVMVRVSWGFRRKVHPLSCPAQNNYGKLLFGMSVREAHQKSHFKDIFVMFHLSLLKNFVHLHTKVAIEVIIKICSKRG